MEEPTVQNRESKHGWALTPGAFQRLLNWLDEGADSGGHRYLEMRRRLVLYFDRKHCLVPDELADETLNRVARRLEEEGSITSDAPAHYCYIVARFVFLESLRTQGREQHLDEPLAGHTTPNALTQTGTDEEDPYAEKRFECLERCIQHLQPDQRDLILNYYQGEQRAKIDHHRKMAVALGVTMNALSIRAFRLRDKLEACVRQCLSKEK